MSQAYVQDLVGAGGASSSKSSPAGVLSQDLPHDELVGLASPYNWPTSRKIMTGLICSSSQLITTMSAGMLVPALGQILQDFHIDSYKGQIAFSVFFLGLGWAPFIIAPLSEIYGRRPIWLIGNAFYILWNSLAPVGNSLKFMVVCRFLSACGASVGICLTGPIMADMYGAKDRGKAVAISGILPYLGPALGPIIGGAATQRLKWPWLFWVLSICDVVSLIMGYLLVQETYGPVLLKREARVQGRFNADAGNTNQSRFMFGQNISFMGFLVTFLTFLKTPISLLVRRPVIQLIALALAIQFGTYTLVLGSFATLWQTEYQVSPIVSSLHYIAIAMGACLSAQFGGPAMDCIWRTMKARYPDRKPTPEYRIPYLMLTILPATAGLLLYAWAGEMLLHWIAVDFGVLLFTWASFMSAGALNAYLFDEFPQRVSASASAAARAGTYLLGFAYPILAPKLYQALGYGWGNTLLSLLFLMFSGLVAIVLWCWGSQIRASGRKEIDVEELEG